MILIVCIDNKLGMMFNSRRQTQDSLLRKKMLEFTKGNKLWMNEYSYKQFANETGSNIVVDNEFLNKALDDEYCFVENNALDKYIDTINKMIIFKWNTIYPADLYFNIDLKKFRLMSSCEFKGSSHKQITMEEYLLD